MRPEPTAGRRGVGPFWWVTNTRHTNRNQALAARADGGGRGGKAHFWSVLHLVVAHRAARNTKKELGTLDRNCAASEL